MSIKLFKEESHDDSDWLGNLLDAIDDVVFEEKCQKETETLRELTFDQDLLSECLAWRQRFSMPDASEARNKW